MKGARSMIRKTMLFTVIALLALAGSAVAGEGEAFESLFEHYDRIRTQLASDSLQGVPELSVSIGTAALRLEEAEKRREDYSPCCDALGQIARAADEIAASTTLEQARAAFDGLSKPMIRYRERVAATGFTTIHCSMADASWLQRRGEQVGNPYMGSKMPRCGTPVEE
jgi:hypothetical protein